MIDGAVNGSGRLTGWSAGRVRRIQVGRVRGYLGGLALGGLLLIVVLLVSTA